MKKLLVVAVAAAIATPAMADLTIGGSSRYTVRTIDGNYSNDGRVQINVAGKGVAESGMYISGDASYNFNMGAAEGTDDVKMTVGNDMFNVKVGEFEMHKAFASGADTFQASVGAAVAATNTINATTGANVATAAVAATAAQGYEGDAQSRARSVNNVELMYTGIEGTVLAVGTRLADTDQDVRLGLETGFGGISVGANYEIDGAAAGNDGYAVRVGGTFGGVAATLSQASDDVDNESLNVTVAYSGLSVSYQKDKSATLTDTTHIYGSYKISDLMGIAGASLELGAGNADSGANSVDEIGARIAYTF